VAFLEDFLSTACFPLPVATEVVRTYAPDATLRSALLANLTLGAAGVPILNYKPPSTCISFQISLGDLAFLGAVLSSRESRSVVLESIVKHWSLSAVDQMRLANRPMAQKVAKCITHDLSFTQASRARARKTAYKDAAPWLDERLSKASPPPYSRLKYPGSEGDAYAHQLYTNPPRPSSGWDENLVVPPYNSYDYRMLVNREDLLYQKSLALHGVLGVGLTKHSRSAWMITLDLSTKNPAASLDDIVGQALRFSRMNHTSNEAPKNGAENATRQPGLPSSLL
jgi:hypothetical protein